MRLCCIPGCGQSPRPGIRLFNLPKIRQRKGKSSKELSQRRQNAWMSALGKNLSVSDPNALQELEVCNSHFISGKMAALQDVDNVDWVPSINLGTEQGEGKEGTSAILRCSVFDCTASNQGSQGCSFYRIPKVNERGESRQFADEAISGWMSLLGMSGNCTEMYGSVYVCQAHYSIETGHKRRRTTSRAGAIFSDSDATDEPFTNDDESSNFHIFPKFHPNDSRTADRLQLMPGNSFASSVDDRPFVKSGEILRNENGNFVFLCGHCGDYNVDCLVMVSHINEHFDKKTDIKMPPTSLLPLPEFVSCKDVKDVKVEPSSGETCQEFTNKTPASPETIFKSEMRRTRGRPRKNPCKTEQIDTAEESSNSEWSCSSSDEDDDYEVTKKKNSKKRSKETESNKGVPKRVRVMPNNCYQCAMEPPTTNESDLRRHKCVVCKEWFQSHIDFKMHLSVAHGKQNADDFVALASEYNEFTCYICESNVRSLSYLMYHMKGHFDKYLKFQCDECGLIKRSKGALHQHKLKHENKLTECDLCNKTFSNMWRMRRHRVYHKTELNFVCEVCSKAFKLRKYLTRHMAVHSDAKVHCRYCDKSFSFATSRRAHEKSQHNVP